MTIHPSRAAQAVPLQEVAQVVALQADKVPTEIPAEYADYADVFCFDLAMELFENTGINEYAIELVESKQSPYGLTIA